MASTFSAGFESLGVRNGARIVIAFLKLNLENKGYGAQIVNERRGHSPALHKNKMNMSGTSNKTLT